jgi:mannonate dehydratase
MKLCLMLPVMPDEKWRLARQVGVDYAVTQVVSGVSALSPPWDYDSLHRIKTCFQQSGLILYGLEGDQFDMRRIKLGLPGRDEDIERFCAMLRNMGALSIPLLCYNFMAQIGWYRTTTLHERGGALVSAFDYEALKDAPLTEAGVVPEERMWESYTYFVNRVLPVAERVGVKMALHPDDPPVSPLRGIARILRTADALERAMAIAPSTSHGIAFCQATFKAMGEDLKACIRRFGSEDRILIVHLGDIRGTGRRFRETFHDNGPTDMPEMLRTYHEVGFDGPVRPDYTPTMEGERDESSGHGMLGRLFAIGYIKGMMETLDIPIE